MLTPVLFLLSMGVGLGSLVNSSSGGIEVGGQTVPYLLFVVPAILAVTCMSTGMGESSWPVLGAIKWFGTYHAMLATPARVVDILLGHCAYVVTMVGLASAIFMVVALAFGGFASWTALWCLPVALLVGLAFATPVTALSSRLENDTGFNMLFRLVQTPLMLFSGTFFPISQLPDGSSPSRGSPRSGTPSRRHALRARERQPRRRARPRRGARGVRRGRVGRRSAG